MLLTFRNFSLEFVVYVICGRLLKETLFNEHFLLQIVRDNVTSDGESTKEAEHLGTHFPVRLLLSRKERSVIAAIDQD